MKNYLTGMQIGLFFITWLFWIFKNPDWHFFAFLAIANLILLTSWDDNK